MLSVQFFITNNKINSYFHCQTGSYSLVELLQDSNLDKKDILTLVADMLLAGIDTTSYTSSFMFYLLAKHPNVQDKLREQINKGKKNFAIVIILRFL